MSYFLKKYRHHSVLLESDLYDNPDTFEEAETVSEETMDAVVSESDMSAIIEHIYSMENDVNQGLVAMEALEAEEEELTDLTSDSSEDNLTEAVSESIGFLRGILYGLDIKHNQVHRYSYIQYSRESIHYDSRKSSQVLMEGFKEAYNSVREKISNLIDKIILFFGKMMAKVKNYFNNSKAQIESMEKKFTSKTKPSPTSKLEESEVEEMANNSISLIDASGTQIIGPGINFGQLGTQSPDVTIVKNKDILAAIATGIEKNQDKANGFGAKFMSSVGSKGIAMKKDETLAAKYNISPAELLTDNEKFEHDGTLFYLGNSGTQLEFLFVYNDEKRLNSEFKTTGIDITKDNNWAGAKAALVDKPLQPTAIQAMKDLLKKAKKLAEKQTEIIDGTYAELGKAKKAIQALKSSNSNDNENDSDTQACIKMLQGMCPKVAKLALKMPQSYISNVLKLGKTVLSHTTEGDGAGANGAVSFTGKTPIANLQSIKIANEQDAGNIAILTALINHITTNFNGYEVYVNWDNGTEQKANGTDIPNLITGKTNLAITKVVDTANNNATLTEIDFTNSPFTGAAQSGGSQANGGQGGQTTGTTTTPATNPNIKDINGVTITVNKKSFKAFCNYILTNYTHVGNKQIPNPINSIHGTDANGGPIQVNSNNYKTLKQSNTSINVTDIN